MSQSVGEWQQEVWEYYDKNGRHDLPWRLPDADGGFDPYKIAVSEIMLQQTQVSRVIPKFQQFISKFPTVTVLANATLADVIVAWNGLGYNRRAKFLWQAAGMVESDFAGKFPQTVSELIKLPGIGVNTAGAIAAYAYNRPVVFIETNIRTVLIHHAFTNETNVQDKALIPELQIAADAADANPARSVRTWYWALMDYGTFLKQTVGNVSQQSAHYARQSAFEGSKRQLRGQVLRALAGTPLAFTELMQDMQDDRLQTVLDDLAREGIIAYKHQRYHLGTA